MEETSVLIVGAGPTGLALAVTLGLAGIQVSAPCSDTSVIQKLIGA